MPKWCNFIASLALIQQFVVELFFFSIFRARCSRGFKMHAQNAIACHLCLANIARFSFIGPFWRIQSGSLQSDHYNLKRTFFVGRWYFEFLFWILYGTIPQWARKFKKVQVKKPVKSNKSFFSWNCIFGSFKLFPSSKIDFWPFLKLQKVEFGQK